eukprot:1515101-Amphidinium_carterae.1
MNAVSNYAQALFLADEELQEDREILLKAASQHGFVLLQIASSRCQIGSTNCTTATAPEVPQNKKKQKKTENTKKRSIL